MKRLLTLLAISILACAAAPAGAQAAFGLRHFDVSFTDAEGQVESQAGAHPYAMTTTLAANVAGDGLPDGWLRSFLARQVPGLLGDTTAYPRCRTLDFLQKAEGVNACPLDTAIGINAASTFGSWISAPVFNLEPPPGVLLRIGFTAVEENVVVDVTVSPEAPNEPLAASRNVPQLARVFANIVQLWGDPSDPAHDKLRGVCGFETIESVAPTDYESFSFALSEGTRTCPVAPREKPFLTMPGTCAEPLRSSYEAFSWAGDKDTGSALLHDAAGVPAALTGCEKLGLNASIGAQPTSRAASSPTGLDFSLNVEDEGLVSVKAEHSGSEIREARVTLPEGMTANPSIAEGLEVCTKQDLADETLASQPGEGCPQASKIGTIEVQSPLVETPVPGALYQAAPYDNLAGNALIAFYIVLKDRDLGILVKQPTRVDPDPETGQLIAATSADIPQLAFSHFRLHFREGGRSPLISPPGCGDFDVNAKLYPWSGGAPVTSTSSFEIISGPNNSPCPSGAAPFHPGFEAGTLNNAAGRYSPFDMRITRQDGEQDITKFSSILPAGVVGKIAGVARCPEAGIAQAASRQGAHGGQEELDHPSCPAASQIGTTVAGAGVGGQLTYVKGFLYLAGPYHGDPLSVVSITPAVAGPFDAGTVVVRIALTLNPVTGVVEADGSASDPIPHILKGIPLNVRDLRVNVDRPQFTLNATSCEEEQAQATLFGGGTVLVPTPDSPVGLSARYQAADCQALGFEPRLGIKLRGGTRRGAHPALRAVVTPRPFKDANFSRAVVRLPHSAFLDQAHIRTICTRVQFAAGGGNGERCPKGAVYGHARAWTPLLDEPLSGPVFLRSSNHNLPDLVVALHGIVDINLASRIDSVKGGIRSTFTGIPDAPVSRFILAMQGGKKGLIINSTNLCAGKHRARAKLRGQNGRIEKSKPVVRAVKCRKAHRKKHPRHHKPHRKKRG